MDTQLQLYTMQVERKHIALALRENSAGRFLRISEEVAGRHNAIIIPLPGLEQFRDALNEVIEFGKTLASPNNSAAVCRTRA